MKLKLSFVLASMAILSSTAFGAVQADLDIKEVIKDMQEDKYANCYIRSSEQKHMFFQRDKHQMTFFKNHYSAEMKILNAVNRKHCVKFEDQYDGEAIHLDLANHQYENCGVKEDLNGDITLFKKGAADKKYPYSEIQTFRNDISKLVKEKSCVKRMSTKSSDYILQNIFDDKFQNCSLKRNFDGSVRLVFDGSQSRDFRLENQEHMKLLKGIALTMARNEVCKLKEVPLRTDEEIKKDLYNEFLQGEYNNCSLKQRHEHNDVALYVNGEMKGRYTNKTLPELMDKLIPLSQNTCHKFAKNINFEVLLNDFLNFEYMTDEKCSLGHTSRGYLLFTGKMGPVWGGGRTKDFEVFKDTKQGLANLNKRLVELALDQKCTKDVVGISLDDVIFGLQNNAYENCTYRVIQNSHVLYRDNKIFFQTIDKVEKFNVLMKAAVISGQCKLRD